MQFYFDRKRNDFAIVTLADHDGRLAAMISMEDQPILRSEWYTIPKDEHKVRIDRLSVLVSAYGDLAKHVALRCFEKVAEDYDLSGVYVAPKTESDQPPAYEANSKAINDGS